MTHSVHGEVKSDPPAFVCPAFFVVEGRAQIIGAPTDHQTSGQPRSSSLVAKFHVASTQWRARYGGADVEGDGEDADEDDEG